MSQQDNNTPLVSIIIPAYNTAQYIHRAIGSALRQTHTNIEALVIDDGSTDDTLRVAEAFAAKDKRVRVFHQENAGVSVARNLGIHEAKGEYLVFLDSDDWLEDEAVEILLDAQVKYPDKLVMGNYRNRYELPNGNILIVEQNEASIPMQFLSTEEVAESFTSGKIRGAHNLHAKIFRRDIILKHNISFIKGACYAEDAPFMFTYLNKTEGMLYINKFILMVYMRTGSATRASYNPSMLPSLLKAYEAMINLPENTSEVKENLLKSEKYFMCGLLCHALDTGASRNHIKELKKYIKSPPVYIPGKNLSRKTDFLFRIYLPVTVSRLIVRLLKVAKATAKKILRKN